MTKEIYINNGLYSVNNYCALNVRCKMPCKSVNHAVISQFLSEKSPSSKIVKETSCQTHSWSPQPFNSPWPAFDRVSSALLWLPGQRGVPVAAARPEPGQHGPGVRVRPRHQHHPPHRSQHPAEWVCATPNFFRSCMLRYIPFKKTQA